MSSLSRFDRPNLSGIPTDWLPVTLDDDADNTGEACIARYSETVGTIACQFRNGQTRTIPVVLAGDRIEGEITRVLETDTTVTGAIFALQG